MEFVTFGAFRGSHKKGVPATEIGKLGLTDLGSFADDFGCGFRLDPLRARFGVGFGAFRKPFRETFGSLGNYLGLSTQPPSCTRLAALRYAFNGRFPKGLCLCL